MPHVFDLDPIQAQELVSPGLDAIRAKVELTTESLPEVSTAADGAITFGATYVPVTLDVTELLRNSYVVIKNEIPPMPTTDGQANQQGSVTIQIDNTARYWGVLQAEGVLDGNVIQDSIIEINATCGPMPELPMYKGKVVETPEEEEGKTTFRTKSILWDVIDVPLVLERSEDGDINPDLFVKDSGFNYTSYEANNVKYYHGCTTFDQFGRVVASVDNDSPDKVYIKEIDLHVDDEGESVPLGKFTITFISWDTYVLTQPDGRSFTGSPFEDFTGGFVTIPETAWEMQGITVTTPFGTSFTPTVDPVGTNIEFNTYYTASGNPWSLCKNILYKALSDEWGEAPAEPSTLPVDWDAFTHFETRYPQTIYFSETNKENEVFSPNVEEKPKRVKDILQKILDCVGCQLTYTPDGKVSCVSTMYPDKDYVLREYNSSHLSSGNDRKASHSIFADGPKHDRMVIRYGKNPITDDYASREVEVIVGKTLDKFNTYEVATDYFKSSVSERFVKRLSRLLFPMAATSNRRLKMSFLPNWGLPMRPGDKFEVDFTTQPVLPNTRTNSGRYWMAYKVSVKIGNVVEVEAIEIDEPIEGDRLCEGFVLCESRLC